MCKVENLFKKIEFIFDMIDGFDLKKIMILKSNVGKVCLMNF